MFENNILTFNPGADENANKIETFDDVRGIQRQLKEKVIKLETEADENTSGPASFMVLDPDGNVILIELQESSKIKQTRIEKTAKRKRFLFII